MAGSISLICPVCNNQYERYIGHYNRAVQLNKKMYCSKACFSVGRKLDFDKHLKTPEQLKAEKALYDKEYREKNAERLKKQKKEAFQIDYKANPEKYRLERQRRMKSHVEYCRQPEYKAYKKQYDHRYKLELKYGEFWEAASVLVSLENELDSKQIKLDNGIINKSLKRKRKWKTLMQNH